jgi:hypothetical protein
MPKGIVFFVAGDAEVGDGEADDASETDPDRIQVVVETEVTDDVDGEDGKKERKTKPTEQKTDEVTI